MLEDCLKSRMLNRKAKSCPTVAVVQKRRKWRLDRVWSNGKKKWNGKEGMLGLTAERQWRDSDLSTIVRFWETRSLRQPQKSLIIK